MPTTSGRREDKKRRTRARIEAAALELFRRRGFDATTVDAIADAADIAPRTFFHYFETKEDVVLADYADRLDRILGELEARPDHETPWTALRASFLAVAADFETQRDHIARRFAIMAEAPTVRARALGLQAGWEDAVTRTLARRLGTSPADLAPRLWASSALAAIRSAQQHWVARGQDGDLPSLVEWCFDRLGAGLDHADDDPGST